MTGSQLSATRFLAFVNDSATADTIRTAMQARGISAFQVETGDVATATAFLTQHPSPQTLLVELPGDADRSAPLLDKLADVVNPACKVLTTGPVDTLRFYQWLLGLGIQEYLLKPFTPEQLLAAIEKGSAPVVTASGTPSVKKLVAVIGARGGVGTTTIATHLAAIFAQEQQLDTALIDLDPQFGSVALGLDLEPSRGLRDALEKPDRVDGLFLDRVVIRPFPKLAVLSAEDALQEIIIPQANAGPVLFGALAEKFGIVVADVPRQVTPLTRHVLSQADAVVVVAEPHVIDLRDALRVKDFVAEQLKRPAPLLFINREGIAGKHGLPVSDFTKHYGTSPAARLPWLPDAMGAAAQGELLLNDRKLSPALEPLRQLAERISGVTSSTDDDAPTGLLAKLRGKKGA
jgi:pilus assembly protein CpaE